MRKTKKVKTSTDVTINVLCNGCGKEMISECCPDGNGVHIDYTGGFDSDSRFFGDMCRCQFDLCEECLFELTKRLMIKPTIEKYDVREKTMLMPYKKRATKPRK